MQDDAKRDDNLDAVNGRFAPSNSGSTVAVSERRAHMQTYAARLRRDAVLSPAQDAFLARISSAPSAPQSADVTVLSSDERQAARAHFEAIRAEYGDALHGQWVAIDVANGRYACAGGSMDARYEFERKYGSARLMTFFLGRVA
jgi:hypothetical protein